MKICRYLTNVLILAAILCLSASPSYAYWIWSPKSGRWINPKYSVKPNPKEQLKYAQELYNQAKYKEARSELGKLIKYYPKAAEAAEAQFYIGLSYEAEKLPYEAFKAYQKIVDKYPFSSRIDEVLEKELKIGQDFMAGTVKRKALGMELPLENPAIEIYRKVVENSSYGKNAAYAQYLLGMALKDLNRFQEAQDEFEKVITTYPESVWVEKAKFQSADCASKIAPKADYDQELTKEAKKKFEEFVASAPAENLTKEAQSSIDSLKEKETQGKLKVAEFYEKQKKYDAARIYYQDILDSCSYCESASKARDKVKELEKK